jgi:hypothetical protein
MNGKDAILLREKALDLAKEMAIVVFPREICQMLSFTPWLCHFV